MKQDCNGNLIGRQEGEAFVLTGETALPLRYPHVVPGTFILYGPNSGSVGAPVYTKADYELDENTGTVRRTSDSAIPDWSEHPLYGNDKFDHEEYTDCSNQAYTVYASYDYIKSEAAETVPPGMPCGDNVVATVAGKLRAGRSLVMAVLGDSISTGAEASSADKTFFGLLARRLEELAGGAVAIKNLAVSGETSSGGAARVMGDIVPLQPDLVTIGYGMNDQNLYAGSTAVSVQDYMENLSFMIRSLREHTVAELVLITPCMPNPRWRYASGRSWQYAAAVREAGARFGVAVADVHDVWEVEIAAGKTPESLLLNNINHPNDYGHALYMKAFERLMPSLRRRGSR